MNCIKQGGSYNWRGGGVLAMCEPLGLEARVSLLMDTKIDTYGDIDNRSHRKYSRSCFCSNHTEHTVEVVSNQFSWSFRMSQSVAKLVAHGRSKFKLVRSVDEWNSLNHRHFFTHKFWTWNIIQNQDTFNYLNQCMLIMKMSCLLTSIFRRNHKFLSIYILAKINLYKIL